MIKLADAENLPLDDKSVQLTFTSPPYVDCRWYGDKKKHVRHCVEWVDWMLRVVKECCRVTDGLVLVNCAGVTRKHRYQPAPEMLLSEWWKQGGECWRPVYWHRVGIPGSGGKQWLRADVEYVLAFKPSPGPIPWADNTACGHIPKWAPGGEMSNRQGNGSRRNEWGQSPAQVGHVACRRSNGDRDHRIRVGAGPAVELGKAHTKTKPNGEMEDQFYVPPKLANPGNMLKVVVGGGVMGHKLAHENEAPFPVKLATFFIKSFCPPDGTVLDPFAGSGTVGQAALETGRKFICCDIRQDQCDLMQRRIYGTP